MIYFVPGVGGGVALGLRPKSARCAGVRAISVSSSLVLMSGRDAMARL